MASAAPMDANQNSTLVNRWYVLFMMMLAYTINIADRYVMSTVLEPIRVELGLSDSGVAFLTGVSLTLFYVTMGIPLSWIADRHNRTKLLALSMTVWSAMTAMCGMSQGYWQLLLARIGVGVGEAMSKELGQPIDWVYVAKSRALKRVWEEVQELAENTTICVHESR